MCDDQKRQERTELLQATAELLSGLAPIHEREEPQILGKRTAVYLNGDVWRSAVKAYERAGAVLNRLRIRDADFVQWSRLHGLTVLAKHITGTADDGDDIRVTHCLYELLEDAAEEARETMHADTRPGADAEEEGSTILEKRLAGVRRIMRRLPRPDEIEGLGPDEIEQFHEDVRNIDRVLAGEVAEEAAHV